MSITTERSSQAKKTRKRQNKAQRRQDQEAASNACRFTIDMFDGNAGNGKPGAKLRKEIADQVGEVHRYLTKDQITDQKKVSYCWRKGVRNLLWHRHGNPCQLDDATSRKWFETLTELQAQIEALNPDETAKIGWDRLREAMPALCDAMGYDAVREHVDHHRARYAQRALWYYRARLSEPLYLIGPPEIARRHEPLRAELAACALGLRLMAVDRVTKADRDRERQKDKRREAGAKPMGERTKVADAAALAALVGCHQNTVLNHAKKGTLAGFVEARKPGCENCSRLTHKIIGATNFHKSSSQGDGEVKAVDKLARIESLAHAPDAIVVPMPDPAEAHAVVRRVNVDDALRAHRRAA